MSYKTEKNGSPYNMQKGEIVLCNMTLTDNEGNRYTLKKQVFSTPYEGTREVLFASSQDDRMILTKIKADKNLRIQAIDIIVSVGFRNKIREGALHTSVKGSDKNERNKDGVYN